jgi:hypothetical protein
MEKIKALITTSLTGGMRPTDEEVGEATIEALEVIASIADSLKRIAVAAEEANSIAAG